MDKKEKKIFQFELEKSIRSSVEDELKRKYTWIATITAIVISVFGTGSFYFLVKDQLYDAKLKLGVAKETQQIAKEKIDTAVKDSEKLISDATRLTNEMNDKLDSVKQDIAITKAALKEGTEVMKRTAEKAEIIQKKFGDFEVEIKDMGNDLKYFVEDTDALKENIKEMEENAGIILEEFQKDTKEKLVKLEEVISISQNSLWEDPTGEIANRLDEYSEKTESYKKLGGSLEAENYLILGDHLYYKWKNEEALKNYDEAIKLKPGYAEAWVSKGVVLEVMERYTEALKAFKKAIGLNPDIFDAWIGKAVTHFHLANYDKALEAINKAIEMEPDNDKGWYNRACIYSIKGEKEKALNDLKKAIGIDKINKDRAKKEVDFNNLMEDEEFQMLTE